MEQRKKIGSVLLRAPRKRPVSVELFPAEQWEHGQAGLYRLRKDGVWQRQGADKYEFCALDGVAMRLARLLADLFADAADEAEMKRPELPRGTKVSVEDPDTFVRNATITATEPIQAIDGRWYVGVTLFGKGQVFVPVEEVTCIR